MIVSDTATSDNSGSTSASRMTFVAGNSIRGAAELALQKWSEEDRPAIGRFQSLPPKTTPLAPETGYCEPNYSYGYVAQAVNVEVDTETGHIKILEVISADDVGKAINPQQIVGQIGKIGLIIVKLDPVLLFVVYKNAVVIDICYCLLVYFLFAW